MAAIVAGDILFKYSVKTGSAGNSTAQAAPNNPTTGSLGTYMSTSAWPDATLNGLYDDISGAENSAGTIDYRCIFVHNNNGANVLQNAVVYIQSEVAGGANIAIATDNIAASPIGQAGAQAANVANETTAPSGVSAFSTAAISAATGLALGNIAPAQCKAIWIRRTATASAALSADGVTIAVSGDTGSL